MKTENDHKNARDLVDSFAARGRYHFTSGDFQSGLGVSTAATRQALGRLARRHLIASPARGFYVIIPPEYRSLGCLPADQFIPALMDHLALPYYAGLLSAAQYHGAAHHRPQEFQIFLEKNRRPIRCGAIRVVFIARKRLNEVVTQAFNTPRGTIAVSTPEATAIDLAGYPHHAGGLDQTATVLSELAERLDPILLAKAAERAPLPWVQRLGYLLEVADEIGKTDPLKSFVRKHARDYVLLSPGDAKASAERASNWKLIINTNVELEL